MITLKYVETGNKTVCIKACAVRTQINLQPGLLRLQPCKLILLCADTIRAYSTQESVPREMLPDGSFRIAGIPTVVSIRRRTAAVKCCCRLMKLVLSVLRSCSAVRARSQFWLIQRPDSNLVGCVKSGSHSFPGSPCLRVAILQLPRQCSNVIIDFTNRHHHVHNYFLLLQLECLKYHS